jgi:glucose-6-phosphate 1-dehydrogenase
VEVLLLEGEFLTCLRWCFDTKELLRVAVKSSIIYFATPISVFQRVCLFLIDKARAKDKEGLRVILSTRTGAEDVLI